MEEADEERITPLLGTDQLRSDEIETRDPIVRKPWVRVVKLVLLFTLWYALNVIYNVYNKRVTQDVPLYWSIGALQLAVGPVYVSMLWALRVRPRPKLSLEHIKTLLPIAFFHMMGHVGAVVSLGSGAVSFTHIVKSAEPVFTSVFSAVLLSEVMRWQVYASLIPIIVGVAIASATELDFSWVSFAMAMVSNVSCSLRAILSKSQMRKPMGENMNAVNLLGVISILSLLMIVPLCLAVEGYKLRRVYTDNIHREDVSEFDFWSEMLLSGLTLYLYLEVAYMALDEIHPITHAVGNTIKRVVIIVATILIFGNKITALGAVGCVVAICGTFVYSLAKQAYK